MLYQYLWPGGKRISLKNLFTFWNPFVNHSEFCKCWLYFNVLISTPQHCPVFRPQKATHFPDKTDDSFKGPIMNSRSFDWEVASFSPRITSQANESIPSQVGTSHACLTRVLLKSEVSQFWNIFEIQYMHWDYKRKEIAISKALKICLIILAFSLRLPPPPPTFNLIQAWPRQEHWFCS